MKSFKEYISEASFKIDMPDMPAVYVDAKSAGEVKKKLRTLLKKPMDVEVSRVNPAKVKKAFRLRAQGKDEDEEEVKEGKQKPYVSSDRDGIHVMNGSGKVAKSFDRNDRDKAQAYLKKHYDKLMKEEAELDELTDAQRAARERSRKDGREHGGSPGQKRALGYGSTDHQGRGLKKTHKPGDRTTGYSGDYRTAQARKNDAKTGSVSRMAYDKRTGSKNAKLDALRRKRDALKRERERLVSSYDPTELDLEILVLEQMIAEALDKEDEPKVKEIIKKLKGASKAHAGQAQDLEKAVSEKRGRPRKDGTADGDLENIQMQLRKSVSLRGKKDVEFSDGKKKKVDDKIARKVLQMIDKYRQPKDKQNIVTYIAKSEKNLMNFASGKAKMDDMDPEAKRRKLLGLK